jgi:hypothetical protein
MLKLAVSLLPAVVGHGVGAELEYPMVEELDDKELVRFKEMIMANSVQLDSLAQLLIEKRIFTEDEFYAKLKEVLIQYEGKEKPSKG